LEQSLLFLMVIVIQHNMKIIITICIVIIIWFGCVIVNLERYHYANQSSLCINPDINYITDFNAYIEKENCLENARPRASALWDLYYALIT
jgi:hypothetical protein